MTISRRDFLTAAGTLAAGSLIGCAPSAARVIPAPRLTTTPYNNWRAISFARTWCGQMTNACGVYLQGGARSDCAHFIAHCLDAGGITIRNPDASNDLCPQHLAIRNTDIVARLKELDRLYTNVTEIGLTDAIIGDYGFLDRPDRPYHAFMICEPVDLSIMPPPAVKVYAHSTNRCCEPMSAQWKQWFSTLFRITDA